MNQAIDRDHDGDSEDEESALISFNISENDEMEAFAGVVLEIQDQRCDKVTVTNDTMAFGSTQDEVGINKEIWIGDTGASSHMTHSRDGMTNMRPTKSWIIFGNGQRLQSTHVGDKHGVAVQKEGKHCSISIKKCEVRT